jgi:hypothetical protein
MSDEYISTHTSQEENDDWLEALGYVLDTIMKDVQQRIAFRTQLFIRNELNGYKLRDEELLVFARARGGMLVSSCGNFLVHIPGGNKVVDAEMMKSLHRSNSEDYALQTKFKYVQGGGGWYPTVHKALWLLCVLYQNIPVYYHHLWLILLDGCF